MVVQFSKGKRIEEMDMMPGLSRFAEMRADGTWQMRNYQGSLAGTWSFEKGHVAIRILTVPSGKLTKPERWTFTPRPNRSRLTVSAPAKMLGVMEWRFDTQAKQRWQQRMQEHAKWYR